MWRLIHSSGNLLEMLCGQKYHADIYCKTHHLYFNVGNSRNYNFATAYNREGGGRHSWGRVTSMEGACHGVTDWKGGGGVNQRFPTWTMVCSNTFLGRHKICHPFEKEPECVLLFCCTWHMITEQDPQPPLKCYSKQRKQGTCSPT